MRHLSRRLVGWALGASLLLALVPAAWARQAVVTTKDGRQFTGDVISDNENGVVMLIAGIRTPVKREDIQNVEYQRTIDEQYQEKKAAIAADNVDERYNLARWLFEEKAYRLALAELNEMAEKFPDDGRVRHLKPLVEARLKLARESEAAAAAAPAATPPPATPATPTRPDPAPPAATPTDIPPAPAATTVRTTDKLPDTRLNPEQINQIKIYEVRIEDRPTVIVPIEVLNEVMEKYSADPAVPKGRNAQNAVRRAEGWRQLDLLFQLRAREYYPLVSIRSDPESIRVFRTGIHRRYVLPYCGSNECHGGQQAGDFFLFQLRPNDEDTVYTNFFILSQYKNQAGLMIDRENPERSLLVQYGLARNDAETPHPPVPGWAAQFRNRSDPRIEPLATWIRTMQAPAPRYPVDYVPPSMKAPAEQTLVDPGAAVAPAPAPAAAAPAAPAPPPKPVAPATPPAGAGAPAGR